MVVFDTSGTFTVPAGVTKIMIEVWGGGAGAIEDSIVVNTNAFPTWAPGGGGGYGKNIVNVSPGAVLNVVVGQGGIGLLDTVGNDGGSSAVIDPSLITLINASGGTAGKLFRRNNWHDIQPGIGGTSNAPINITGGFGNDWTRANSGNSYHVDGYIPGGPGYATHSQFYILSMNFSIGNGAHGRVIIYY
jgi:hypothetical protein